MNIRKVTLHEGPCDGSFSMASHDTAIQGGEVYVHDGGPHPDRFVHANALLARLPFGLWQREHEQMQAFSRDPGAALSKYGTWPELPAWRFNAWVQLLRYDCVALRHA